MDDLKKKKTHAIYFLKYTSSNFSHVYTLVYLYLHLFKCNGHVYRANYYFTPVTNEITRIRNNKIIISYIYTSSLLFVFIIIYYIVMYSIGTIIIIINNYIMTYKIYFKNKKYYFARVFNNNNNNLYSW